MQRLHDVSQPPSRDQIMPSICWVLRLILKLWTMFSIINPTSHCCLSLTQASTLKILRHKSPRPSFTPLNRLSPVSMRYFPLAWLIRPHPHTEFLVSGCPSRRQLCYVTAVRSRTKNPLLLLRTPMHACNGSLIHCLVVIQASLKESSDTPQTGACGFRVCVCVCVWDIEI